MLPASQEDSVGRAVHHLAASTLGLGPAPKTVPPCAATTVSPSRCPLLTSVLDEKGAATAIGVSGSDRAENEVKDRDVSPLKSLRQEAMQEFFILSMFDPQ
jgi:hypothetical protein